MSAQVAEPSARAGVSRMPTCRRKALSPSRAWAVARLVPSAKLSAGATRSRALASFSLQVKVSTSASVR